jgi:UrcA family protein
MRIHGLAFAVSALGLMLAAASPAGAQQYPPTGGYANLGTEEVIVTAPFAPRYRVDHNYLNVPLENVALSEPVRYDDLDLRTRDGAHALRMRIRTAVNAVCGQLIDMYPVGEETDSQCYRNALSDSMARADAAIQNARSYPPGRYRDMYYGGY